MPPDELHRRDRLRLVARVCQRREMRVLSDHIVRMCSDGTVGELVVVRVSRDDPRLKRGIDEIIALALQDQTQPEHDLGGKRSPAPLRCDLFIF